MSAARSSFSGLRHSPVPGVSHGAPAVGLRWGSCPFSPLSQPNPSSATWLLLLKSRGVRCTRNRTTTAVIASAELPDPPHRPAQPHLTLPLSLPSSVLQESWLFFCLVQFSPSWLLTDQEAASQRGLYFLPPHLGTVVHDCYHCFIQSSQCVPCLGIRTLCKFLCLYCLAWLLDGELSREDACLSPLVAYSRNFF